MMDIICERLCRGNGKVFIELRATLDTPGDRMTLGCRNEKGAEIPCKLYPDGRHGDETKYVAVVPQIPDPLHMDFTEFATASSEGVAKAEMVIDPLAAKWRSRFAYAVNRRQAKEIRDFDERFCYDHASVEFTRVIPLGDIDKVSGQVEVPNAASADIAMHCYTADMQQVDASFVITSDSAAPTRFGNDASLRTIGFSIDLPAQAGHYLFCVDVAGDPSLRGFAVLEGAVRRRMGREWTKHYVDAAADSRYPLWLENHQATPAELRAQSRAVFDDMPLFSIVVPLYKTPVKLFDEMVGSVLAQSYGKWELLLVNASPEDEALRVRIEQAKASDERVRVIELAENEGISLNTRAGIKAARGDFVCFLDHDDTIEPDALFEYAAAINDDEGADVLYCDEDKLMRNGTYATPFFKPCFSLDLLRNVNYVCHFLCVRRTFLDRIVLPDASVDGAQDHDMVLKLFEAGANIRHVPRVLYHWRLTEASTALDPESKPYAAQAGIRAVEEHLKRMGVAATVEHDEVTFSYNVTYDVPQPASLVSVIVPTKDEAETLTRCIESIEEKTTYPSYEIVLVENNSTEEETFRTYEDLQKRFPNVSVAVWPGEFNFSAIVNFGAEKAKGDILLFLNNDMEVITPDWMSRMVGAVSREEVGIVGARLWYPDETLQHGGVLVIGEVAGHIQTGMPRGHVGYFGFSRRPLNLMAVTGACLMTKRTVFDEVGGFDEGFPVAFNDVDFCVKVHEAGKLIVYDPAVELYHYESLSRGYEDNPEKQVRFTREIARFRERWARYCVLGDPYYNRNFSQDSGGYYQLGI